MLVAFLGSYMKNKTSLGSEICAFRISHSATKIHFSEVLLTLKEQNFCFYFIF
jgi:hypothetical protein